VVSQSQQNVTSKQAIFYVPICCNTQECFSRYIHYNVVWSAPASA